VRKLTESRDVKASRRNAEKTAALEAYRNRELPADSPAARIQHLMDAVMDDKRGDANARDEVLSADIFTKPLYPEGDSAGGIRSEVVIEVVRDGHFAGFRTANNELRVTVAGGLMSPFVRKSEVKSAILARETGYTKDGKLFDRFQLETLTEDSAKYHPDGSLEHPASGFARRDYFTLQAGDDGEFAPVPQHEATATTLGGSFVGISENMLGDPEVDFNQALVAMEHAMEQNDPTLWLRNQPH